MSFHQDFDNFLKTRFPLWQNPHYASASLSPLLISPHVVRLPRMVLDQVENAVRAFNSLTTRSEYRNRFSLSSPGNRSILMSYDCHLTETLEPKLIEINTNASFGLIGDALREFQKVAGASFTQQLKSDIECELKLAGLNGPPSAAIVDTQPDQQKLYVEFVFYKNLFELWGWPTEICDTQSLQFDGAKLSTPGGSELTFVYNRDTDFYLTQSEHRALKEAYLAHKVCVSPHPYEYALLADKNRMIEVTRADFLDQVAPDLKSTLLSFVPRTIDLGSFSNREDIWAQRKRFVFKPKTAYGSKAVYRGSSISRKTFDTVVTSEFVAQEFVPAPEMTFNGEDFKYDLRFYAYQDQIRLTMARLYRGQLTNFNETGGGFAPVEWI